LYYSGPIEDPSDRNIIRWATNNGQDRRKNVYLILATFGGEADAAYRMARSIQRYTIQSEGIFTVIIPFFCKSAGTLLSIGADIVVMGYEGELGPLDVQMIKKDEVGERSSGLIPSHALTNLRDNAFSCFEKYFLDLRVRSGFQISARLAAKIASDMATGLFSNIYSQIDPMLLGQTQRSMLIGWQYGQMLDSLTKNLQPDGLETLLSHYPSHGFVIDIDEAATLFRKVYALEGQPELCELVYTLQDDLSNLSTRKVDFRALTDELRKDEDDDKEETGHETGPENDKNQRSGHPGSGEQPEQNPISDGDEKP